MNTFSRFCPDCRKSIKYSTEFGYNECGRKRGIKELDDLTFEHRVDLCLSCNYFFETCSGNPTFGECVGNDNVTSCDKYREACDND